MWDGFKKLFSKSKTANAMLGDVIFATPQENGVFKSSFFEWRVKASIDKNNLYVGVAMKPDASAGAEGSPTNYINFDLDAAIRLRDNLDACIKIMLEKSKADRHLHDTRKF